MDEMQSYIQALEGECTRRFGVGLLDLAGDLWGQRGTMPHIQASQGRGVSPKDFVEAMKSEFVLVDGDRDGSVYRAALVNFARESGDWALDGDGGIVFPHEDGILRLHAASGGKAMEFVVSMAEGENLSTEGPGPIVPQGATFSEVARGPDIDDALAAFDRDYEPGASGPRLA